MCCSTIQPSPILNIVDEVEEEQPPPVVEDAQPLQVVIRDDDDNQVEDVEEDDDFHVEERLLRSIEAAALENQRLLDTVRHFQEVIQVQTTLLEERIRRQTERDENNNLEGGDVAVQVGTQPGPVLPTVGTISQMAD